MMKKKKKRNSLQFLHRQPTVIDDIELLNRTLLLPAHSIIPYPLVHLVVFFLYAKGKEKSPGLRKTGNKRRANREFFSDNVWIGKIIIIIIRRIIVGSQQRFHWSFNDIYSFVWKQVIRVDWMNGYSSIHFFFLPFRFLHFHESLERSSVLVFLFCSMVCAICAFWA